MRALALALTLLLSGCASTWQPFSDDAIGQAKLAAYEACMAGHLLQTQKAEDRCLQFAKRAAQAKKED